MPAENLSAALDIEGVVPITSVQLDAMVVLKIVKHCRESAPSTVTGQLMGLDVNGVLEVTHSFPMPKTQDSEDYEAGSQYQLQMMRCLREVNVDDNSVGWYQSTNLGNFMNQSLIEHQFEFQQALSKSVLIIHDVARSSMGNLNLRALRLTPAFMKLYKEKKFTSETLAQSKLSFSNIFEELPITIRNSALLNALLFELESDESLEATASHLTTYNAANSQQQQRKTALSTNFDMLDLSMDPYIERNLEQVMDSIDDHTQEQGNYAYWQRSVERENKKKAAYLANRKAENARRQQAGQQPLPNEDVDSLFKLPAEPSRLDHLLITGQIDNYCKQINAFAGPTLSKLFAVGELQK
ncbi:Eukaryotic translation initiation factor 3 subunit H [Actinomortierella ambigua]|uniref:Eukaryotic translation initiation factor 3 subunit H n=1 Tax=Actinomortierella ambigua TaxID=1343610 RepID=A0A9P6U7D0_9FUNG|nr:Eukaryotic translation initiation factor 3 subunit H [Actinomortierella ambigua]KAG0262274.1 Eukaryotic translation initiation factor 3 subunit H [Actinomortierella ambigua]